MGTDQEEEEEEKKWETVFGAEANIVTEGVEAQKLGLRSNNDREMEPTRGPWIWNKPIHFLKAHDGSYPNLDENTNKETNTVTNTKTKTPRD